MDTNTSACITNELTQGMELAMLLKSILSSESSSDANLALMHQLISSYERAISMVKFGDSGGQTQTPSMLSQPESSVSIDGSPQSHGFNQPDEKLASKKRKVMPTWRDHVRVSIENGVEGNTDDGYSWRKYGQKVILGARFPRSYYRCTYQHAHNCIARKQVQRTDEDPTVFEITYKGQHTCKPAAKKHEVRPNNHQRLLPPNSGDMMLLSNFKENLRVVTSDPDAAVPCSFSIPSASFGIVENYQQFTFLNEADNDFSYFTEWENDFQHHDDSNLSGIISATASTTNSPLAFAADPHDVNPNFPFCNSGFFI